MKRDAVNGFIKGGKMLLVLLFILSFAGCVYDFIPDKLEKFEDMVVIDGDIVVGDYTYVSISKAIGLYDTWNNGTSLDITSVWVESGDGGRWSGSEVGYGGGSSLHNPSLFDPLSSAFKAYGKVYAVNTTALPLDKEYRLCVEVAGKGVYKSELQSVKITPKIEAVTYRLAADSTNVDIMVSTTGGDGGGHYKWDYTEDWNFSAPMTPTIIYRGGSYMDYITPAEAEEMKWCFGKNYSSDILVYSTDKLAYDRVDEMVLTNILSNDSRMCRLYSILVEQKSLSKEGYEYWSVLKRNSDETGGLFGAQPSDMRGNIVNADNPEEVVLGYINVSTKESFRLYISSDELDIYEPKKCETTLRSNTDWSMLYLNNMLPYMYGVMDSGSDDRSKAYWVQGSCVDCHKSGGTKKRPDFWPEN